jgi:hypothetical protein
MGSRRLSGADCTSVPTDHAPHSSRDVTLGAQVAGILLTLSWAFGILVDSRERLLGVHPRGSLSVPWRWVRPLSCTLRLPTSVAGTDDAVFIWS